MANNKLKSKKLSMRQKSHKGVDNIMDKTDSIIKNGQKKMFNMRKKIGAMKNNLDSYIQRKPIKSALIAAGIGALFTAILIKKRR